MMSDNENNGQQSDLRSVSPIKQDHHFLAKNNQQPYYEEAK